MELSRNSKTVGDTVNTTAEEMEELVSTNAVETDLPRFCLELDPAETKRALAWVNSICFVYLAIGVLGLKPSAPVIHRTPPAALEAAPTIIEPLVSPVQTISANPSSEEAPSEKTTEENSAAVAVTLDSPAVAFSVPTVGNVLVPLTMAQPPPPRPMQGAVPISTPHIEQIGVTGIGGSRPAPPYPEESLMNREEGRVVLLIDVDESGKITSVAIKDSSGHSQLDRATADYVRRHWFFAPAAGPQRYEAPIYFHLNAN